MLDRGTRALRRPFYCKVARLWYYVAVQDLTPKPMDSFQVLPNSRVVDDIDNSPNQKLIEIHPADCEDVLKHRNHKNRPIRKHTVARFLEDMKNDRFKALTHQSLSFDVNGNLLDGQHRLSAIAQLKKSFVLRVWFNRDPEDFAVIDTGVARLASDNLHHLGVPRPKIAAPGIKNILLFKQSPGKIWTSMAMPSNTAIADFYCENQSVVDKISTIVQEASSRHRLLNRTGLFVTCFLALEAGYTEMEVAGFAVIFQSERDLPKIVQFWLIVLICLIVHKGVEQRQICNSTPLLA